MTSKPVSALLTDLGVTSSHSRLDASNDNPYSEAQYRTLKYLPDFPDHFESLEHAKQFCIEFFYQYNYIHRHSGVGWHTPASVHFGTADTIDEAARRPSPRRTTPTRPGSAGDPNHPPGRPGLDQPATSPPYPNKLNTRVPLDLQIADGVAASNRVEKPLSRSGLRCAEQQRPIQESVEVLAGGLRHQYAGVTGGKVERRCPLPRLDADRIRRAPGKSLDTFSESAPRRSGSAWAATPPRLPAESELAV